VGQVIHRFDGHEHWSGEQVVARPLHVNHDAQ
jgi:hypothetical protein